MPAAGAPLAIAAMTYEADNGDVTVERADGIATITLDSGPVNTVDVPLAEDLREAVDHLESEPPRVAVLRGAGDTYCAGGDLSQTPEEFIETIDVAYDAILNIFESDTPYVASFKNIAIGGGIEFGVACDLRVAGEETTIAVPEATIGIIPPAGAIRFLAHLVGIGRARDLLLTGRHITGAEAERMGLVNRTTDGDPDELAHSVAETLASNSTGAMAAMLKSLREAHRRPISSEKWDIDVAARLADAEDFRRGQEAFRAGESIDFRE